MNSLGSTREAGKDPVDSLGGTREAGKRHQGGRKGPVRLARHQGGRKGSMARHQGGRKEPFEQPGRH